jgi:hypothetical protein
MENKTFDAAKRRTLKLLAGSTAGLFAATPVLAGHTALFDSSAALGDSIDCTLISRADLVRAYLLLQNKTDKDIIAARFNEQFIHFDGTTLNMADAYVEPVVVSANDRVMVRLNLEAGLQPCESGQQCIDLNHKTSYLPQGTRVVELLVRMHQGTGSIDATVLT